jgi:hypothetical protein
MIVSFTCGYMVCPIDACMLVELTKDKLGIINNALNEVCNGIDLEGEFDTRMGCTVGDGGWRTGESCDLVVDVGSRSTAEGAGEERGEEVLGLT